MLLYLTDKLPATQVVSPARGQYAHQILCLLQIFLSNPFSRLTISPRNPPLPGSSRPCLCHLTPSILSMFLSRSSAVGRLGIPQILFTLLFLIAVIFRDLRLQEYTTWFVFRLDVYSGFILFNCCQYPLFSHHASRSVLGESDLERALR